MTISTKVKLYGGISIIILVIVLIQIFYSRNEAPIFTEVKTTNGVSSQSITLKGSVGGTADAKTDQGASEIVVDIKGAVVNPGVYRLANDMRIQDVLDQAGGPTEEADLNQVNLARKIYDEMLIYIPIKGESYEQSLLAANGGKISINQSSLEELQKLNGIGEAKAKEIIDYRTKNGTFATIEEIMKVPGIGEKLFQQFKNDITVH